jgi:hypothetical protein
MPTAAARYFTGRTNHRTRPLPGVTGTKRLIFGYTGPFAASRPV